MTFVRRAVVKKPFSKRGRDRKENFCCSFFWGDHQLSLTMKMTGAYLGIAQPSYNTFKIDQTHI